ncbi:MAG: ubiquinone biosynthesis protein UbiH [Limnohabitans sp.]|jgi:2-polyprenyl-6-methoxyphenol hydroxylase-like FAD-dependent oxidoreductase|uniref:FAD-dependent monooxygenase n=1 Tax=Limnohabitans sp. TaxID=1907725 RepID=UPI0025CE43B3|nr:FAD-dependent monooxygenase [Limnohabitans sp.]MCO4089378.1 ubiquinone biosynthesis protein UbiH [Limnohabitans sp.]
MALNPDICIRGAGIVGRTLAVLLAREQLNVTLVATPDKPNMPDVRAYSLNGAAKALLQDLRCWPNGPAVTPVHQMQIWGDQGGQLDFVASEMGVAELNWMVDVPDLEERLNTAVQFQTKIEVVNAPVAAPLTVVCEGRASQTRTELGVGFDITHYEQHALATRLVCEHAHQCIARQWFGWSRVPGLAQPQAEILALLPMGGEGGREVALVWSVHPLRAQELMAMSAEDFAVALASACELRLGGMQMSAERAVWPLQLARAERWIGPIPGTSKQSFALAGDAAHSLHPLAGQGLNVGLADVAELVQVIRAKEFWRPLHDIKLLRRYERARQADVQAMGLVTDGLQRLFAQPGPVWQNLRNWGMRGFDRSGPLKHWMTQRAMGQSADRADR